MGLHSALSSAGFSLTAALPADAAIAIAPALAAPLAAMSSALLVGNTRDLWPRFVAAYRADASLRAAQNPFDTFVETALTAVIADRAVRFAHRMYDQAYVPMQRLAAAARLGVLSATHLVIHPTYGPWFSLRAVIACETPALALAGGFAGCAAGDCQRGCEPLFEKTMASGGTATWRDWFAVRAACTTGTAWRFSDEQIIYHYTKDQRVIGTGMTLAEYAMLENSTSFQC